MSSQTLVVLYEDNHLLAVNKPAGLATMGAEAGTPSLVQLAKQYLKQRYRKPGNVYLGVVSRLDSPVSGVVVLARTSKAAGRLAEQFRKGTVQKTYWALVPRRPRPPQGEWSDWLAKDESRQRMIVGRESVAGAKLARLSYRTLREVACGWLLEIEPGTGRKHQIRVQLAARSYPILGDCKYGSSERFAPKAIALHAHRLVIEHPVRREPVELLAPPPAPWREFGVR